MPRSKCLTYAELAAFHLGDLPEEDLAVLAEHLESCSRCQEAVQALDGSTDPTLAAYRQAAMASPLPSHAMPQRVGNYEVLAELGRGGMGSVWLADRVDGSLNRQVALKLPHAMPDGQFLERFQRERDILASFIHPNIAQIFDAGVSPEGHPFIACSVCRPRSMHATRCIFCRSSALPSIPHFR